MEQQAVDDTPASDASGREGRTRVLPSAGNGPVRDRGGISRVGRARNGTADAGFQEAVTEYVAATNRGKKTTNIPAVSLLVEKDREKKALRRRRRRWTRNGRAGTHHLVQATSRVTQPLHFFDPLSPTRSPTPSPSRSATRSALGGKSLDAAGWSPPRGGGGPGGGAPRSPDRRGSVKILGGTPSRRARAQTSAPHPFATCPATTTVVVVVVAGAPPPPPTRVSRLWKPVGKHSPPSERAIEPSSPQYNR